MKQHLLLLFLLLNVFSSFSQIKNYAFKFTNEGNINCGPITQLNDKEAYTFQCWISPSVWTQGAYVWKRGMGSELVGLKLGTEGNTYL